jgi:hypothetical protein
MLAVDTRRQLVWVASERRIGVSGLTVRWRGRQGGPHGRNVLMRSPAHAQLASRTDARSQRPCPCACDLPFASQHPPEALDGGRARRSSRARTRGLFSARDDRGHGAADASAALYVAVQDLASSERLFCSRPGGGQIAITPIWESSKPSASLIAASSSSYPGVSHW